MAKLSLKDLERYDRQIRIDGFGESGQKKLKEAKIVIIGAGGLGCPVSIYLAAAGIGNITIIHNSTTFTIYRCLLHFILTEEYKYCRPSYILTISLEL